MKRVSLFLLLIFLSSVTLVNGQTTEGKLPNVTKGYYSIGNNLQKLAADSVAPSMDSVITPQISKGYYSIKDKNRQITQKPAKKSQSVYVPSVTKGYYSIGNNVQKLIQKQ